MEGAALSRADSACRFSSRKRPGGCTDPGRRLFSRASRVPEQVSYPAVVPGPDPKPYVLYPGVTHEALTRYQEDFGGELELRTYGEFGRTDGPSDAIAHGMLQGPVTLFGADAGPDENGFSSTGLLFALLSTAGSDVLRSWFDALADGGRVVQPLAERPWRAWDGQVRDRFGLTWLIGWEPVDGEG